jgi:4a-hydroxytetrahydrobiopterin dehydratase
MADRLDDDTIRASVEGTGWERRGDTLVKEFTGKDFAASLSFVNRVGALAESRSHHPDIAISWNRVTLSLTTHSAGGLTAADLELAKAVDALAGPGS